MQGNNTVQIPTENVMKNLFSYYFASNKEQNGLINLALYYNISKKLIYQVFGG